MKFPSHSCTSSGNLYQLSISFFVSDCRRACSQTKMLIYGIRTRKKHFVYEKAAPATAKTHKKVVKFYYFQKNSFSFSFSSLNFRLSEKEKERVDFGVDSPDVEQKHNNFRCSPESIAVPSISPPSGNNTGKFMALIIAIMCCFHSLPHSETTRTLCNSTFVCWTRLWRCPMGKCWT